MIKCPNCKSVTEMQFCFVDHLTSVHSVEHWRCSWGCIVNRKLKAQDMVITYPNGGVEFKDLTKSS